MSRYFFTNGIKNMDKRFDKEPQAKPADIGDHLKVEGRRGRKIHSKQDLLLLTNSDYKRD
jgi:hypothetical protein